MPNFAPPDPSRRCSGGGMEGIIHSEIVVIGPGWGSGEGTFFQESSQT
jgi:hypothetical protein